MTQSENRKQIAKNVAKVLADLPIDNKQERDAIRARLRQTYAELKPLTSNMRKESRQKLDELGDLCINSKRAKPTHPTRALNSANHRNHLREVDLRGHAGFRSTPLHSSVHDIARRI
jgi:hypothetical protein